MVDPVSNAAKQWQSEGWVLVPDLVPASDIDAAVEELWGIFPRPEEFRDPDHPRRKAFLEGRIRNWGPVEGAAEEPAFREEQFDGHETFPFTCPGRLNRLVVHPRILDFAEAALGQRDIRLYQAGLFAKYAGAANYAQPLHLDRNHSIAPARMEAGWWFLEGFLYLNDVDEDNGAPQLLRRGDAPRVDPGRPLAPGEAADAYGAAVSAPGSRGSFLAYRGDVWHRAVDLRDPAATRFVLIVCYKLAGQDWIGFDALSKVVDHWLFPKFVAESTPRELEAVGLPGPGHAFWTSEGVDALALKYPDLDVTPWREELRGTRT